MKVFTPSESTNPKLENEELKEVLEALENDQLITPSNTTIEKILDYARELDPAATH